MTTDKVCFVAENLLFQLLLASHKFTLQHIRVITCGGATILSPVYELGPLSDMLHFL